MIAVVGLLTLLYKGQLDLILAPARSSARRLLPAGREYPHGPAGEHGTGDA